MLCPDSGSPVRTWALLHRGTKNGEMDYSAYSPHPPIPVSPPSLRASFSSQRLLLCALMFIICYYSVYFSLISPAQENINIMKSGTPPVLFDTIPLAR